MSNRDVQGSQFFLIFEDVVRFFRATADPGKCPICFAQNWEIPLRHHSSPVTVVDSGLTINGSSHYELKMICTSCGFLRSHSVPFIQKWLEANPPEEDSADE